MGASVIKNAKIFLGGMDLSGDLNALALNYSAEMLDATGFGDDTRVKQGGLLGITCNAEGFVNTANSDPILHDAIAASAEPVTIGANGGAEGDAAYMFMAAAAGYTPGGAVGEHHKFSFDAEQGEAPDGTPPNLIRGQIHQNGVETVSGNSTGIDLGALADGSSMYATLHVYAASAGDSLDVTIESDDNAGFTSATERASFSLFSALGSEWLEPQIAGPITDTHWRVKWVIGGSDPSFTFAVGLGIK